MTSRPIGTPMARILIVDADVMLLDLLQLQLSGRGLEVQVAEDPAIALRSIIGRPPDIILLDPALPYMDGLELMAAVKGDPATRHVPVLVISGDDDASRLARARALGADAILRKPVHRDELVGEILSRLNAAAPRTER